MRLVCLSMFMRECEWNNDVCESKWEKIYHNDYDCDVDDGKIE